jgi:DivIVA domain-containing protein
VSLTPADIHHAEFGKASLGKRGYDEEQVDALLDEVSQEMAELLEEKNILQLRAGRADETSTDLGGGADVQRAQLSAVAAALDRARRDCERAEQNARQVQSRLAEARRGAAAQASVAAPAHAGDNPDIVMAMAQRTADDHLNEAHRQSDALAAEAREKSERVIGEARQKAHDIEENTRRREIEAAAELRAGDAAVRQQIQELTGFAESYRAALTEHVRRQSQYIDSDA